MAKELSKDPITQGFIWLVNRLGNQDLDGSDESKCSNGDRETKYLRIGLF